MMHMAYVRHDRVAVVEKVTVALDLYSHGRGHVRRANALEIDAVSQYVVDFD